MGTALGDCRAREILDRVGDKWSLYLISLLGEGTKRFSELKREAEGISQRMLSVTLRGLERDGLVTRTMYRVMPPRVEYALTDLGRDLLAAVRPFITWLDAHVPEIETARKEYDARAEEEASAFE
jgi:DNA-binding HxlR family transcriptional regulator